MRDEILAGIFYTLVHDFRPQLLEDARVQIEHYPENDWEYVHQVNAIKEWAKENDFATIETKAEVVLSKLSPVIRKRLGGAE